MQRILIRGGRVLPMTGAPERTADVLVEDGVVADVRAGIEAADAAIVDAGGAFVLPGLVDVHRHVWQTPLRTVAADWSLFDYVAEMRFGYAGFFGPDDVRLANHVGALEALDAGITTLVDHCHVLHSPAHADAAVAGLRDAGIRAVFCYGTFASPAHVPDAAGPDGDWRAADARRVRRDLLPSDEGLVRFGFAPAEAELMPFDALVREIALARELGALRISCHVAMGAYDAGLRLVARLGEAGLLGPDLLFVHGAALTDDELVRMRDAGCALAVTPETELQMGMGLPAAHRALAAGVATGLGVDVVSNYAGDLLLQGRLALQSARAAANAAHQARGTAPATIEPRAGSVLHLVTAGGARAAGVDARAGTLEPGRQADVIVVRTDAVHLTPATDAAGALVLGARPDDVDTVLVAGRIRKRHGRLVDADWPALRGRLLEASARIRAGFAGLDLAPIRAAVRAAIPRLA